MSAPLFNMVNVGCGPYPLPGYVNIDIMEYEQWTMGGVEDFETIIVDITKGLPFETNSVSLIRADQFIEHLEIDELINFIEECDRVLRFGGELRVTFPDVESISYDVSLGNTEKIRENIQNFVSIYGKLPKNESANSLAALNFIAYVPGHKAILSCSTLLPIFKNYFSITGVCRNNYSSLIVCNKHHLEWPRITWPSVDRLFGPSPICQINPCISIVILLSGREGTLDRIFSWLNSCDLPSNNIEILLFDNSNDNSFLNDLMQIANKLVGSGKFKNVTVKSEGYPVGIYPDKVNYFMIERHFHVSKLYCKALSYVKTPYVLTFEDDLEPPKNGLMKLWNTMVRTGASSVAGVYEVPDNHEKACFSIDLDRWVNSQNMNQLGISPIRAGFVPGGFTLWDYKKLSECFPSVAHIDMNNDLAGWDNRFSRTIRNKGGHILAHPGVLCKHHHLVS